MATGRIVEEDIKAIAEGIGEEARKLSGKTLLITGGAGFLGNYFISTVHFLNGNVLEKPCRIISADNFSTGVRYRIEEGPQFRPIRHNVKDHLHLDEGVDYVIHAAGIASPKFYREMKIETIDAATMGTKNMLGLAHAKKANSMLYFSSSEVYGDPDPDFVPTPETYHGRVPCIGPRANYDESKRLGETYCRAYYETHGVPVKMVRPFNIYGPGMRLDDYRVIPNFAASILNRKPMPLYGGGNSTRTFCYVTDARARRRTVQHRQRKA
ncbi:NAD-dependent epimerase/dehydratase family protein [Candidatus Woesearchaeota archaeon]|nr:NAD-dependent epimerase/dehydratase family protein [Candidatus Woesearchaeota archaeon]